MRPEEYLAIPEEYGRWLGGLRWAPRWEAVEHIAAEPRIGLTFAMAGQVARFVEGLDSGGARPFHVAYVLHLLHLLGVGGEVESRGDARRERLARLGRESFRSWRNVGALASQLCRDVPRQAGTPDWRDVAAFLDRTSKEPDDDVPTAPQLPSLEPEEFEQRVLRALDRLSDDDLRHWLRYGRGPVAPAAEAVAEAVERTPPAALEDRLAEVARRPRLAGAARLAAHLEGALAWPARRVDPDGPPAGGYADVANRGRPEQILPAQFALEPLEFLRRFAERELLYFHREEPRARADEELVLVLDQGVRTWGDVRLVLAAAALALGRRAARKGIPLRLATTGREGEAVDAAALDMPSLGALLEASDLTPHPGPALARVLEERPGRLRDVVLLTHPRSLAEPGLAAAARTPSPGTRLFAVAVDAGGEVLSAELRRGVPVPLGRCRVSITPAIAPDAEPAPAVETGGWRGDVEPIGFPFPLGAFHTIKDGHVDFDHSGHWLLAASGRLGTLHAWKVDGTAAEMLPRAMIAGTPLREVQAVVGVAGGFVVAGRVGSALAAAHYDLGQRTCTGRLLGTPPAGSEAPEWIYAHRVHAVIARSRSDPAQFLALDLDPARHAATRRDVAAARRWAGLSAFAARVEPTRELRPLASPPRADELGIHIDAKTGTVTGRTPWMVLPYFTPRTDGVPTFTGAALLRARSARGTLGLLARDRLGGRGLHLFVGPDPEAMGTLPAGFDVTDFTLSRDGRRVARRIGATRIEVRDVGGGPVPALLTARGRAHPRLDVWLGDEMLFLRAAKHTHVVCWAGGDFSLYSTPREREGPDLARLTNLPSLPIRPGVHVRDPYDPERFVGSVSAFGLTAVLDALGHVALLGDAADRPAAMVYAFRGQVAAWGADGSRLGPPALIGGPPTPDAPRKIAAGLVAAMRGRSPAR